MSALPTISLPTAFTIDEDSDNNSIYGISVADTDGDILTVTLSARGMLSLGQFAGLTFIAGDGLSDSTMTFSGLAADINAALAGLTYTPLANDELSDVIQISVSDGSTVVTPGTFAATLELSSLLSVNGGDGSNGFVIVGIDENDESGISVASAGDVNGDGIDDLIIGSKVENESAFPGIIPSTGETYIVFGSDQGFGTSINLASLDGTNGFVIDQSNLTATSAGDINGDGIDDIVLGFPDQLVNGSQTGRAVVVFGSDQGFDAEFSLDDIDGTNGFSLNGIISGSDTGFSVSSAGDINGDGIEDLIIGARSDNDGVNSVTGASYVVYGSTQGFASTFQLSSLLAANGGDGTAGFVLYGEKASEAIGHDVSAAGDVNGDGIDDFIVSGITSSQNGNIFAGVSHVVFGSNGGLGAEFDLSTLNGSNGFTVVGTNFLDQVGYAVSSAGDINGDGFDDVIIGVRGGDPGGVQDAGEAYVFFGSNQAFSAEIDRADINGTNGFIIAGISASDESSISVSSAGDINGDGLDDILISALRADPNGASSGQSYVIFGSDQGFATTLNLSTLDGTNGFVINGIDQADLSGYSVSAAGDVNNDGVDDLIIGAPGADQGQDSNTGESYVIFGRADIQNLVTTGSLTININAENDAPEIAGDQSIALNEGGSIVLTLEDFAGTDIEDAPENLTYNISNLANGSVQVSGINVSSFTHNQLANGDVSFIHDGSVTTTGGFSVSVEDTGGASSASLFISAAVSLVNDLPTVSAPASITVLEDASSFSVTGVTVADEEGDSLRVTLSAEGTLSLGQTMGLTFTEGDGVDDSILTFSGSISDINTALAGLTYSPFADDDDGDSISISVFDGTEVQVAGTFAATFELSSLLATNGGDGSLGFVITNSDDTNDELAYVVSAAGDVNGDGVDDVIVGSFVPAASRDVAKDSYVVFGDANGFGASIDLASIDGSNGFRIGESARASLSGISVSAAGDLNGDGFDDLLIGEPQLFNNVQVGAGDNTGTAYVIFGSNQGFASIDLSPTILDGTNGFIIDGDDNPNLNNFNRLELTGASVSEAGDVNGDGIDDIIVGAPGAGVANVNGNLSQGEAYVIFGTTQGFSASLDVGSLDGTNGFTIRRFGSDIAGSADDFRVTSAGDVNGDGFDDILIGTTSETDGPSGQTVGGLGYVIFGSDQGFSSVVLTTNLGDPNPNVTVPGFTIIGSESGSQFGYDVSSAGDFNADGIDDIILSAPRADVQFDDGLGNVMTAGEAGRIFVIFGSLTGFGETFDISTLDGTNGLIINGTNMNVGDQIGVSISQAGDVNGDGIDDIIIGTPGAAGNDPNQTSSAGVSYVIFGSDQGFSTELNVDDLDGTNGFAIGGVSTGDFSGSSVSAAGDVNGDGFDDLIIGGGGGTVSSQPNSSFLGNGESYVVFGRANFEDVTTDGAILVDITPDNDVTGTANADNLTGTEGRDDIRGEDGDDILNSLGGDDRLDGGQGDDTLDGGLGTDLLNGGAGADDLNGGGGFDTASYADDAAGVIFNLDTATRDGVASRRALDGSGSTDTLTFIESAIGSAFDDSLWGNFLRNTLEGGDGNDSLYGRGGNDTLIGGLGNDLLNGASGLDIADYSGASSAVDVDLTAGMADDGDGGMDTLVSIESVIGSAFDDMFVGSSINDTFRGGNGADDAMGGNGNDTLFGEAGSDTLDGGDGNDRLYGGDDADTLNGDAGIDILDGGLGDDIINGGADGDRIFGREGDDTINGGSGVDIINAQEGNDILNGGDDRDFLRGNDGDDTISGDGGDDRIDGGADTDTVVYAGNQADYNIILRANGVLSVEDLNTANGDEGFDVITNTEFLQFADGIVDISGL